MSTAEVGIVTAPERRTVKLRNEGSGRKPGPGPGLDLWSDCSGEKGEDEIAQSRQSETGDGRDCRWRSNRLVNLLCPQYLCNEKEIEHYGSLQS